MAAINYSNFHAADTMAKGALEIRHHLNCCLHLHLGVLQELSLQRMGKKI